MTRLLKHLLIASCLWLTAVSTYGMNTQCGLAYVVPAGKVTFYHSLYWSGYDIIVNESEFEIHLTTDITSPFIGYAHSWQMNIPSGQFLHFVPNPPDGLYDGGGYGVAYSSYGQDVVTCWATAELDTVPLPTVSLSLSPNPAVVGTAVTATWSSTGASNCSWNGGNLPNTSGSTQLFSSVVESNEGNYWVLCAASDGDTAQANVQLDVVECNDAYTQYNYRPNSTGPSITPVTLIASDPYGGFGVTQMYTAAPPGFPASCQAYCVNNDKRYRIEGYFISGSSSYANYATKTQDSPSCMATDRTQSAINSTITHETIHVDQYIDTFNDSNDLIKLNPTFDDDDVANCYQLAATINAQIEYDNLVEDADQTNHTNHTNLPRPGNYCDANNLTVEFIDGNY